MSVPVYLPWTVVGMSNLSVFCIGYLKQSTMATLWRPEPVTFGKCIKENPDRGYALGWAVQKKGSEEEHCISHSGKLADGILFLAPRLRFLSISSHCDLVRFREL